jgi:hypothetical protein
MVKKAGEQIAEGEKGKAIWIAQRIGEEKSVNLAIVHKHFGGRLEVMHWIGKEWGTPESAGVSTGTAGSWSF